MLYSLRKLLLGLFRVDPSKTMSSSTSLIEESNADSHIASWHFRMKSLDARSHPDPSFTFGVPYREDCECFLIAFKDRNSIWFSAKLISGRLVESVPRGRGMNLETARLRLAFLPHPAGFYKTADILAERDFNIKDGWASTNLGPFVENSPAIQFLSLLKHSEELAIQDGNGNDLFRISNRVERDQIERFISIASPY